MEPMEALLITRVAKSLLNTCHSSGSVLGLLLITQEILAPWRLNTSIPRMTHEAASA